MNVIELDRATIRIGDRDILVDTSFAIRRGEFIGVLGPNGAGTTTLMRAILGLLPPRAGSLRVFGRAPRRGDPNIGYLPQVRTVLPDLRVRGFDATKGCEKRQDGESGHDRVWRRGARPRQCAVPLNGTHRRSLCAGSPAPPAARPESLPALAPRAGDSNSDSDDSSSSRAPSRDGSTPCP